MLKKLKYVILLSIVILFFSCKRNRLNVDVSHINIDLQIIRFDKDLSTADINNIDSSIIMLENKYGDFFNLFNHKIISIGGSNSIQYKNYLIDFLTDYTVNEILENVNSEFVSTDDVEADLNKAFKYYKYYFPDKAIPTVITFFAGFNQSIVIDNEILAIGLDKYLGNGSQIYRYIGVPNYKKRNMHRHKIVSDCMRAIATTDYEFNDSVDNLLSNMIYEGKIMYYIDAMLPDQHDSLKIGFSEMELRWCTKNESKIWTYFISEKLLFTTDYMQIKRYIDDSPFTATFSQNSPGRIGIWLGWQIIRSYMQNNPEISLAELMENSNYQQILNQSKYKP